MLRIGCFRPLAFFCFGNKFTAGTLISDLHRRIPHRSISTEKPLQPGRARMLPFLGAAVLGSGGALLFRRYFGNARQKFEEPRCMEELGKNLAHAAAFGPVRFCDEIYKWVGIMINLAVFEKESSLCDGYDPEKAQILFEECIKELINKGFDLNAELCKQGFPPLHKAVIENCPVLCRALLKQGAVPLLKSLDWAALHGRPEMVKLLLESGEFPERPETIQKILIKITERKRGEDELDFWLNDSRFIYEFVSVLGHLLKNLPPDSERRMAALYAEDRMDELLKKDLLVLRKIYKEAMELPHWKHLLP